MKFVNSLCLTLLVCLLSACSAERPPFVEPKLIGKQEDRNTLLISVAATLPGIPKMDEIRETAANSRNPYIDFKPPAPPPPPKDGPKPPLTPPEAMKDGVAFLEPKNIFVIGSTKKLVTANGSKEIGYSFEFNDDVGHSYKITIVDMDSKTFTLECLGVKQRFAIKR